MGVFSLTREIAKLRAVLVAYEEWEAELIFKGDWSGQNVCLTDDLYDRMIEIQDMRNKALGRLQPVGKGESA